MPRRLQRRIGRAHLERFAGLALLVATLACGGPPPDADLSMPAVESLGLTPEQLEDYTELTLGELVARMEAFAEDPEANAGNRETYIRVYNGRWVGWTGLFVRNRIVKPGLDKSEIAVHVSAPSAAGLFPTTVPVLFVVGDDHPVHELGGGDVVRFAGRLEFDGGTRRPWVLDARWLPSKGP